MTLKIVAFCFPFQLIYYPNGQKERADMITISPKYLQETKTKGAPSAPCAGMNDPAARCAGSSYYICEL
jgi:hypothetical protein